ncbi:MAG: hypothetical protein PVJ57_17760 [Phycisphaerae bacterium]|jgi:hypothetical protein
MFAKTIACVLLLGLLLGLPGCATLLSKNPEPTQMERELNALERSKFRGRFLFRAWGAPLSIWNCAGVGPNALIEADGDVDFTGPPASLAGPAPTTQPAGGT